MSLEISLDNRAGEVETGKFGRKAWRRAKRERNNGLPENVTLSAFTVNFTESFDSEVSSTVVYHQRIEKSYTLSDALCAFLLSRCMSETVSARVAAVDFNDREADRKIPNPGQVYHKFRFSLNLDVPYTCNFEGVEFSVTLSINNRHRHVNTTRVFYGLNFSFAQPVASDWVEHLFNAAYNYAYPQVNASISVRDNRTLLTVFTNDNGFWVDSYQVPKRRLDTVFLDGRTRDRLERLLAKKFDFEWYRSKGLSAKLSVLLHGRPGTGKTSLIRALASEISCDIHVLNLNGIKDDAEFNKLIRQFTEERDSDTDTDTDSDTDDRHKQPQQKPLFAAQHRDVNFLVIEDIDCIFQSRKTKDGGFSGVTLSTLLNMLDGFMTVDNLIVVITTNFPEKLDEALKRPGRVDVHIEMSYPKIEDIVRCYRWIYGLSDALGDGDDQSGNLKQHLTQKRDHFNNVSLGLFQQYFVYCYKNEFKVSEQLDILDQMVADFKKVSSEPQQTSGMYL